MARDIIMRREANHLVPFDSLAEQDILALPAKPILVKVSQPRSLPHNRLYWSCIRSICQSGGFEDGEDILHDVTKMGAGCFKVVQLSGLTLRVPDSTAFGKMGQAEFNAFFKRAVAFWQSEGLANWIDPDLFGKISEAA
jgi:hypothetical protein